MSEFQINVESGSTVRLPTGGKYCDRDILVKAEGGGAELNIAYGDTPPEDTSKVWVNCSKPSSVMIAENNIVPPLAERLPYPVRGTQAITVGDKIYIPFGRDETSSNLMRNTILRFDPVSETCEKINKNFSFWWKCGSCVSVGSDIYIVGGDSDLDKYSGGMVSNRLYRFNTETLSIASVATLPDSFVHSGCIAIGNKIYLFAGARFSYSYGNCFTSSYCYDITENKFTKLANVPATAHSWYCTYYNDYIYLFGGLNSSGNSNTYLYKYDITANTFATVSVKGVKQSIAYGCGTRVGNMVYIFPGPSMKSGLPTHRNLIARFNLDTMTWEDTDYFLPEKMQDMACASYGESIYVFGGHYTNGNGNSLEVEGDKIIKIPLDLPVPENNLWIKTASGLPNATLMKSETISLDGNVQKAYKGNQNGCGEPVEILINKNGEWVTP